MKICCLPLIFGLTILTFSEAEWDRGHGYHNEECFQQNGERICCRGFGEFRRCGVRENRNHIEQIEGRQQIGPSRIQRVRLTEEQRENLRVTCASSFVIPFVLALDDLDDSRIIPNFCLLFLWGMGGIWVGYGWDTISLMGCCEINSFPSRTKHIASLKVG